MAYILRWKNLTSKRTRVFSVEELVEAEHRIIAMIQRERFATELYRLKNNQLASAESNLSIRRVGTCFDQLQPFLDDQGLIRVGGRLKKSNLSYEQKHPLLLPSKHTVTDMIIRKVHIENLHSGIQS